MITVSVKKMASAIEEAEVFSLPDMSDGTAYLYDYIYNRLSQNTDVRLSEIDWDSFELNDIDAMRTLYSGTLEANEHMAGTLASTLWDIPPTSVVSAFV